MSFMGEIMNYKTTIERVAPDLLSRKLFHYWMRDGLDMELDGISHQVRATNRHGWRVTGRWSRLDERDSTMARYEPPQDVKDEVVRRIHEGIRFI